MAVGCLASSIKERICAELSWQIYEIDLRIQTFKQQRNYQHIQALEAAKVELQKQILQKKIDLQYMKAQGKRW